MSKVGEILKKRRELETKSLEHVTTQTMIPKKYIVALEEGNYGLFPAQVYAKGFLRNYANFLGFNENEIKDLVSQYELEWQETQLKLPVATPKKILPAVSKTNWSLYIIIFILIIGIFGLLTFYLTKQKRFQLESINYSDTNKILKEEDISRAKEIIVEALKRDKEHKKSAGIKSEKVCLEAFAFEKVWLQAIIDGKKRKKVLLGANQRIKWEANKEIFLTIGNAGGVVFKLNEEYIGALGAKGEVKKVLLTADHVDIIKTHEPKQKGEKISILSTTSPGTSSPLISTPLEKLSTPTTSSKE